MWQIAPVLETQALPKLFHSGGKSFTVDHEINFGVLQQTLKTLSHFKDLIKMSEWFITHYSLPVYQEHCNEGETVLTEEKVEICRIFVCDYNENVDYMI